jgi:predicted MFS family arabinose efflux permease
VITAAMITVGLLLMALLPQWAPAAIGYVLFACGVGLFLALQSAYAMQLLITPEHRGRDMGVLNLTNTIPALIAPSMAYLMAGRGDFTLLLLVLAGLTVSPWPHIAGSRRGLTGASAAEIEGSSIVSL